MQQSIQPRHRLAATARAMIHLMRLHRPIGALLLLWPTLTALWLAADGVPTMHLLGVFIAGTWLMRSAGCVINDFADRDIDGRVARTKDRPLATGALHARSALWLFAALIGAAAWLVLQLNWQSRVCALVALGIAVAYPFAKRFMRAPQLLLGVAFSAGIPMAYLATRATLPGEAWLLIAANFAWIVAYDTQYAMVDRADDLRIGVPSTAILFGRFDVHIVLGLQCACLLLLGIIGARREFDWLFYAGLCIALGLAIWQYLNCRVPRNEQVHSKQSRTQPIHNPQVHSEQVHDEQARAHRCFRAFINNNWFGAAFFCAHAAALL